MSGHSKWASIKHKKGALDAKRGKIFTRLIKELTVAARAGGGDPDMNPRLRTIIADAKSENMPAENIKRAIRRGTGEEPGVSYEEAQYEAYGPGGAAVIIDVLTDNKNRTVGEIRHTLEKGGGNLAAANAVAWMFAKKGYIVIEKSKAPGVNEEKLMAAILDAGADDLQDDGDNWEVFSAPEAFQAVRDAIKALGIEPTSAKISLIPQNYVKLEGKQAQQMLKLMEAIDDHDDVQQVWSNFDIEEKEIEASLVKIFGIDPGSDRTGYGCIETDGSRHRVVLSGAISSPSATAFPEKLLRIHTRLAALIIECRPDCVAIESIFFAANARSALKLGHARGVAMLAAVEAGVPVVEYSPAEIKRAVVGYGRAEKHQVQQMVKLVLGLERAPSPHDVADALAVAICHVHSTRLGLPDLQSLPDVPAAAGRASRTASSAKVANVSKALTSWRHYRPARP